MEYAILATQTSDLNGLIETFRRMIMPELGRDGFSLSFDRYSKDGEARLFVFEFLQTSFLMRTGGYYSVTTLFESDRDGRCSVTIVVSGGPADFGSTDHELKILDYIKNPILNIGKGVSTIYDSAWVYDREDTVRQKAVSSLERVGGDTSVDKIIAILLHDTSDAVLDRSVLSLGRIGGDKAIDPLMKIARRKTNLITTCARALGEIRSRKALGGLNELLAYCEQKELAVEAKAVRQAIQRAEYGDRYREVMCAVCSQPIEEGEELVLCPACGKTAHKTHLLEWLHVHGKCPSCGQNLTESELISQSVQSHVRPNKRTSDAT